MSELLCTLKNSKNIYYDAVNSNASTHFADTPQLRSLVVEVLQTCDVSPSKLGFTVDMGRVVGTTDVVDTDQHDQIIYAIRKNRLNQGYVPFTKTGVPEQDSHVSISLLANADHSYQLSSVWIGTWDDPPFPQELHATADSKNYWSCHAFVWGSQEIEPDSETDTCPW